MAQTSRSSPAIGGAVPIQLLPQPLSTPIHGVARGPLTADSPEFANPLKKIRVDSGTFVSNAVASPCAVQAETFRLWASGESRCTSLSLCQGR